MEAKFFSAKYDGRSVHARGEARCMLGHKIPRGSGDRPDGVFAEWIWDGRKLTVRNDRLGFYPLYYSHRDGEICISPSIVKLIGEGAPAAFDHDALSVFLRYGNFIGEDTPFASIRAVPPNAVFEWEKGNLACSGGYTFCREQRLSREQIVDGFIYLFRQSIRRRLPGSGNFAVPVSGGRDSRHILFELLHQGYSPSLCITAKHHPPRPDEDCRVAARLAAELDLTHEIIDQPESRLESELRKNELTDFCAEEHGWFVPMAERLNGNVGIVYDGIGGDVLSKINGDGMCDVRISQLFESGILNGVTEEIARRKDRTIKRVIHPVRYREMSLDRAIAHIGEELKKHLQAPNPVASYYFWNRTRRKIAPSPYRLFHGVNTVYSPFLDHDVYDFLISLPWRSLQDNTLQTDALLAAFPQYAHMPFEKKHAVWNYKTNKARRHYYTFAHDILRYVSRNRRKSVSLVNTSYVIPTLTSGILSNYAVSRYGWLYDMILYLFQIDFAAQTS